MGRCDSTAGKAISWVSGPEAAGRHPWWRTAQQSLLNEHLALAALPAASQKPAPWYHQQLDILSTEQAYWLCCPCTNPFCTCFLSKKYAWSLKRGGESSGRGLPVLGLTRRVSPWRMWLYNHSTCYGKLWGQTSKRWRSGCNKIREL